MAVAVIVNTSNHQRHAQTHAKSVNQDAFLLDRTNTRRHAETMTEMHVLNIHRRQFHKGLCRQSEQHFVRLVAMSHSKTMLYA
jgi:hypothetical protein